MKQQENLHLYTSPFTSKFEGPFWRNLIQTCAYIQQSDSIFLSALHDVLIIVHSKRQKQWFYSYFSEQLPNSTFMPNIETLDDLMAPQETEWETPEIDYLFLSCELNKINTRWPEKTDYFNRKGVKKALLTFFKQSRQYCLDESLYLRFSTHPYRDEIITLYNSFIDFKKTPAAER